MPRGKSDSHSDEDQSEHRDVSQRTVDDINHVLDLLLDAEDIVQRAANRLRAEDPRR